jgi:hypothetical protein
MVSSLHSEMILQVESLVAPLPFFIEYPFAQFTGTSDQLQRIRYAKVLLNVLCKSFIFLPLEELHRLAPTSSRVGAIAQTLRGWRNLSDGALLGLVKDILEAVRSEVPSAPLPMFGSMCAMIGQWQDVLRPVLEARNRWSHAPSDYGSFLETASNAFPQIVTNLREVLSSVMVVVPKQVKPRGGLVTVSAWKVMGASPTFRTVEFTTNLSADEFVVDKLATYRHSPPAVVPLHEWFEVRPRGTESIDVALFDRMRGDEQVYESAT